jgi:hypothetical protein
MSGTKRLFGEPYTGLRSGRKGIVKPTETFRFSEAYQGAGEIRRRRPARQDAT